MYNNSEIFFDDRESDAIYLLKINYCLCPLLFVLLTDRLPMEG